MTRLRAFLPRLTAAFSSESHERDLALELAAHVDMLTEDNIRAGMTEAEARRAARLHFGGMEQVKEECRDARVLPFLHSLLRDTCYALRGMRRSPGFTAVAAAILAVGIGVNAAVFTVTNDALFKGFPHVDPDNRILYISGSRGSSWQDYQEWKSQAKSFTGMAVVGSGGMRLPVSDAGGARGTCDGTSLSANSFRVLGAKPILGRDFASGDETTGASPVAILSYSLWDRWYGKDASIIGKTIRIDRNPTTVIGVMPAGFEFPHHRVDLWLPLAPGPELQKRENRFLWFAFGRMADGVTLSSAQAEMNIIAGRLEKAYPQTNRDFRVTVRTFRDAFMGSNAALLYGSLWGAVGFVLLIACANLANFLLARAIGRSREISTRIALGAARGRIIRQLLIESLLLSSFGGVFGWLVAIACLRGYEILAWFPGSYDRWTYSPDGAVFLYIAAISTLAGLLFGFAPAVILSKLDVNGALKDGGRGATHGASRKRLAAFLTGAEVTLAVVLLAGAGLMVRSFFKVYSADLGFKPANILTASVWLRPPVYPDSGTQTAFFERLATNLKAIPGVNSLALADVLPGLWAPSLQFELPNGDRGFGHGGAQSRSDVMAVTIGPGYFHTVGTAIRSGREFTDLDTASTMPIVVVNERFAKQVWPGENPIGKSVRLFYSGNAASVPASSDWLQHYGRMADPWRTVVGVASNIVQLPDGAFTARTFGPVVYVPYMQNPVGAMIVLAQTRVPPASLTNSFRREIQSIDPDLVLYSGLGGMDGPAPLSESLIVNNSWSRGFNAALFLVFAAIALLLAAVGVYAVNAHSVSRRTQEIGIRMALGATAPDTRKLVFRQGMLPVCIGLAVGLVASFAVNPLLKSELVKVAPNDPVTVLAASATLMLAAMLGCLIPARRASRIDPAVSLRYE